jgi:hypothetical protein
MKLLMLVAIVIVSVLGIPVLSDTVKPPSAGNILLFVCIVFVFF